MYVKMVNYVKNSSKRKIGRFTKIIKGISALASKHALTHPRNNPFGVTNQYF